MPHFGLMDEKTLKPADAALQRARLHIRGGKRRLHQGKISSGLSALYDALVSAMRWYMLSSPHGKNLKVREPADLEDDLLLYQALARSGILDGNFDFTHFKKLIEKALEENLTECKCKEIIEGIEGVMLQLGVMPFNEADLPPEDPSTP